MESNRSRNRGNFIEILQVVSHDPFHREKIVIALNALFFSGDSNAAIRSYG